MKNFFHGFRAILPITTGIIPFGAVMGSVSAEAHLSFFQTVSMNFLVFAGASQLAAVNLMKNNAAIVVVLLTGLIINLRFILYSAALSPILQKSKFFLRLICSYLLTDQSYAVMSANEDRFKTRSEAIMFYLGTAVCMALCWHLSVIGGYIFGNFAPKSWALDYAIPISFITLLIPTLKTKKYIIVAIFSGLISIILKPMPYNLGLITSAALALILVLLLTKSKRAT